MIFKNKKIYTIFFKVKNYINQFRSLHSCVTYYQDTKDYESKTNFLGAQIYIFCNTISLQI